LRPAARLPRRRVQERGGVPVEGQRRGDAGADGPVLPQPLGEEDEPRGGASPGAIGAVPESLGGGGSAQSRGGFQRERPAQGGGEASGGREAFTNGALGGLHLLGRAPGQKGMIGKDRLVLGCDDHLPDAFRSRYNPGVLLYDEKGALRGHLSASDQL